MSKVKNSNKKKTSKKKGAEKNSKVVFKKINGTICNSNSKTDSGYSSGSGGGKPPKGKK